MAILFVTHFLEQTYAISDRITVLRNGVREGEYAASALSRLELVNKMVGAPANQEAAVSAALQGEQMPAGELFLQARGLGRKGALSPQDFDVHSGEVFGLCGLLGSGRTETARLLFGADKADSGSISIRGKLQRLNNPRDAIRAGIGFCSEDRKKEGAILELSVRDNIILALQARSGLLHVIPRKRQQQIAADYIKWLGIKTPDMETPIVLRCSDRMLVLRDRQSSGQYRRGELDETSVLQLFIGQDDHAPAPRWQQLLRHPLLRPLAALAVLLLIDLLLIPGFFRIEFKNGHLYGSVIDIVNRAAPLMLAALGMTLVIATRGIDIS
eukprot:gene28163-31326_t